KINVFRMATAVKISHKTPTYIIKMFHRLSPLAHHAVNKANGGVARGILRRHHESLLVKLDSIGIETKLSQHMSHVGEQSIASIGKSRMLVVFEYFQCISKIPFCLNYSTSKKML